MVLGVRGIPNVAGGVETHAEQLYRRLAALGCHVEVIVRTPFVSKAAKSFGPIRLRRIWAPRRPGLEALVHSILGVLYAGLTRPEILHIHAIGPAIVTPIARLLGLRVVVTHHGPDYDRDKWGGFARWVLRTGERMGMRYSHARIVISKVIQTLVESKYARDSTLIPNGVLVAEPRVETNHVERYGLEPGRYFLQVSRIVPEKRQLDLIRAFALAKPPGWKLALVGGLGGSNVFERGRSRCKKDRQRSPHGILERRAARTTLLTRRRIRSALVSRGPGDRSARSAGLWIAGPCQRHRGQSRDRFGPLELFPRWRRNASGRVPACRRHESQKPKKCVARAATGLRNTTTGARSRNRRWRSTNRSSTGTRNPTHASDVPLQLVNPCCDAYPNLSALDCWKTTRDSSRTLIGCDSRSCTPADRPSRRRRP